MSNENQNTSVSEIGNLKEKIENQNQYGFKVKPSQTFSIMNTIIEKNVEYIDKSTVVFISGSNLVCYDLNKKTSKFIIRKSPQFLITSMSVGYKSYTDEFKNEPYICLGEFNPITKMSQISTISYRNPNIQYCLNSVSEKDKNQSQEYKITLAEILKNSSYCLAVSKRETQMSTYSKLSFWKFTQEKFISDVVIQENVNYCSYNPQNPLELIVCGKGYLRLWNVFINEGTLKEHPQRFLKGKQEKEHNFIKAQFFDNKSFMFIVGTSENLFYIVEGFQVIYDFNATFKTENIADMNIQNILKLNEEVEDDTDLFNINNEGKEENNKSVLNDDADMDKSMTVKSLTVTQKTFKKNRTMISTTKEDKFTCENNPLRTFFLINNSLILMGFQRSSITYIYKIEKDFKVKKEREKMLSAKDNEENKRYQLDDVKVLRLANNVKSTINIMTNPEKTQLMFMLEVVNEKNKSTTGTKFSRESKSKFNQSYEQETSICLYVFNRSGSKLIFVGEYFKEYFYFNSIKSFDYNEKKKMIYTLTNNNWLRCFDYNNNQFSMKHLFNPSDPPTSITTCPHNNIFGVSFSRKFVLYALFKEGIRTFTEFEVINPIAKFTDKGDYIAIAGESRVNKSSCIYIVDTLFFNTTFVVENLPKIKKIQFVEKDTFLLAMLETSFILGWNVRLDLMTVSLQSRIKEYEKSVESFFFRLSFKHVAKGVEYTDFDYDMKNDQLVVTNKFVNRMSVFNKSGKNLYCQVEMPGRPTVVKIVRDLKCILVGMEDGSLRIYKWPLDSGDGYKDKDIYIYDNKQLLYEINLHTQELNNLFLTSNLKNIISTSVDGSLIISNLLFIKDDRAMEYDPFNENGKKNKPTIEEIIKLCDIFEYRISDIKKKDKRVESLDSNIKALQQNVMKQKETVLTDFKLEIANLEVQKEEALLEEDKKEEHLRIELQNLKVNVENELLNRINDHNVEKDRLSTKYDEKLQLYRNEIERLNIELKDLQEEIDTRFNEIIEYQGTYFKSIYDAYNNQFTEMKQKIDESLKTLVKHSAEYDDAVFNVTSQYKEMLKEISTRIEDTDLKNQSEVQNLKKSLEIEKSRENEFKQNLDQRVQESDKVIQKNSEIKKNIIECTQRTITFQEQILETEKNLLKIAKKLKDLDTKNKHLEQIRFVLEHRMTSLDKEKAPLEGQCNFLEKQKNGLQEEFNKLILQINLKNQFLENKQSQLKACLMQNFEVNDQIQYIRKKLKHLQNEIKFFIVSHSKNKKEEKSAGVTLEENKTTFIALKLKQFYDKYFSNSIEHELNNYQFYLTRLQEETEKMNIANNFDLIMRDKGEEKLIAEKDKLEQIKLQKERGFKRMQNENTILIAECNRLRKNLHEVYMHVVDIELKFEDLTKINPGLNKTEIVFQIKEFIKQTHNKIKNNIREGDSYREENPMIKSETSSTYQKLPQNIETSYNEDEYLYDLEKDIIKSMEDNNVHIESQNLNLDGMNKKMTSTVITNMNDTEKTAYENFLKLPDIKTNPMNNTVKSKLEFNTNTDCLPTIEK